MSGSAMADGLITMLGAASVFGVDVSKNSFRILETSAGSCAVVWLPTLTVTPTSFGPNYDRVWVCPVHVFVKDTGDPTALLSRVWSAIDTVDLCLESDTTLQGTANGTNSIRIIPPPPDETWDAGGATWLRVRVEVEAIEYVG